MDEALVEDAIAAQDNDWFALARAAWRKKFRVPAKSYEERAKQARFMEYRGFYADQARYAIEQAVDDEDL